MPNHEETGTKRLKDKVKDRVNPPPDEATEYRGRALDTLAALLGSDDESIRLQAAQALLQHTGKAESTGRAQKLVQKLSKGVVKK